MKKPSFDLEKSLKAMELRINKNTQDSINHAINSSEERINKKTQMSIQKEVQESEKRINKSTQNSIRRAIQDSEKRTNENIHGAADAIVSGIDKMFIEKEKKDQDRYELLDAKINLLRTEHEEVKKRVSVVESRSKFS